MLAWARNKASLADAGIIGPIDFDGSRTVDAGQLLRGPAGLREQAGCARVGGDDFTVDPGGLELFPLAPESGSVVLYLAKAGDSGNDWEARTGVIDEVIAVAPQWLT